MNILQNIKNYYQNISTRKAYAITLSIFPALPLALYVLIEMTDTGIFGSDSGPFANSPFQDMIAVIFWFGFFTSPFLSILWSTGWAVSNRYQKNRAWLVAVGPFAAIAAIVFLHLLTSSEIYREWGRSL